MQTITSIGGNSTMRKISRKLVIGTAATAIVAAGAGVAFAYWTSSGTGTGTANTGSSTAAITVHQTGALTDMYPGDSAQNLVVKVENTGTSTAFINTVKADSISVTPVGAGVCTTDDYTFAPASPQAVGVNLAGGATTPLSYTVGTLHFNNKADTAQDGCQGATVTVHYSSN